MIETTLQSKARSAGTDTALERLRDGESILTLALIQRMILEELRRCGTSRLETIQYMYSREKVLSVWDLMLKFADEAEARAAQKNSAADQAPDGTGESDDE
jgi:hypothetical protein